MSKSNWSELSYKAPGGKTQSDTEECRYQDHMSKFQAPETSLSDGKNMMPWIPDSAEGYCNHLIKGPRAPANCPRGNCWNCWKCVRCGEVIYGKGSCPKGCSWIEWGWICIYHQNYGKMISKEEWLRNQKLCEAMISSIRDKSQLPIAPDEFEPPAPTPTPPTIQLPSTSSDPPKSDASSTCTIL